MYFRDTIAAISTPPGEGGLAVIRLSGDMAVLFASRLFQPVKGSVGQFVTHTTHYGKILDAAGNVIDDGMMTLMLAPRSYTSEDTAELTCHGGIHISSLVLKAALNAGCRLAEPGEFTYRAFANGRIDLTQAEAVADLIHARTDFAVTAARRQLEGGLSEYISRLRSDILSSLAAVEVTIDFSDEVGDLDRAVLEQNLSQTLRELQKFSASYQHGRLLREGLRIVILGRPNVGKSSLLNRLLHTDRAIVTNLPGTTRDILEESKSILGIPVVLVDSAGIRDSIDLIEQIGMERAVSACNNADVVLIVLDASEGITSEDRMPIEIAVASGATVVVAFNKCDILSNTETTNLNSNLLEDRTALMVSAKTGDGIDILERALIPQQLLEASESVMITNLRHYQALLRAEEALRDAIITCTSDLPPDFISVDLREVLAQLGSITGENIYDELLHRIFHDFCVGK